MRNRVVCIGAYFQNQSKPSGLIKDSDISTVKSYIHEASYGKFQFDIEVIPLVRLPIDKTTNLSAIRHAITTTPEYADYVERRGSPNFNWFVIFEGSKGLASGRNLYVRDSTPRFLIHEIGHTLGMHHASAARTSHRTDPQIESWKFFDERWPLAEYGDGTCTMGGTGNPPQHYNSRHKEIAGWLTPTVISKSGVYDLNPIATHPEALLINVDHERLFYIDFRRRVGFDNSTRTPNNGLQIRFVKRVWQTDTRTVLLRAKFDTRDHLAVGEEYKDLYSDFVIKYESLSNNVAKVRITLNAGLESIPDQTPLPPANPINLQVV